MTASRIAVIVATDEYADASLRRLSSPEPDAEVLARALGDPDLGDFEVTVLHNRESHEIDLRLEEVLSDRRPEDFVLVHFSCHGLKDDSGELYLAATNTLPTRLGSTAVEATFVNRLIRRTRAGQVLLLLDCCYGGAFERGMVPRAGGDVDIESQFRQAELGQGRGRAVITASSAMEYAFEGTSLLESPTASPSIFTSALAEGLSTGQADRDQDGLVGLGELYDYIYDKVREVNPRQTPGKWEYGTQGEFVIARNPNRRIEATSLPDELLELAVHPFAATRHGAVGELVKLASSANLPLAASAREQLLRMREDDSRQVSAAATQAVEQTAVRLSHDHLDFGPVPLGATPDVLSVELEGVPLVQASTLRPDSWDGLTVRKGTRGIGITLLTDTARSIDAQVVIEGPAGSAVLRVTGTVTDHPTPPEPHPPPPVTEHVPRREPRPPVPAASKRRWVGAATLLAAAVGTLLTLGIAWTDGYVPDEHFGDSHDGIFWLVPIFVLAAGALLLAVPRTSTWGLGVAIGAALSLVVGLLQAGSVIAASASPAGGFWASALTRALAFVGIGIAAHGQVRSLRPVQRRTDGRARAALAVLAAAGVVLVVGGAATALDRTGWLMLVELFVVVAGASAEAAAVPLPDAPRRTALSAVTVLCVVQLVTDIDTLRHASSSTFTQGLGIDMLIAVAGLAAVWTSQGTRRPVPPVTTGP